MSNDGGLRSLFRKHLPTFDWQSIETAMTGGGVPDSNYCAQGSEGWIEFKRTSHWSVTLRADQIGWILRRRRHGGRVFIAVRRGGERQDELWLCHGSFAKELKLYGLRKCPPEAILGRWMDGPSRWDWKAVSEHLLSDDHL